MKKAVLLMLLCIFLFAGCSSKPPEENYSEDDVYELEAYEGSDSPDDNALLPNETLNDGKNLHSAKLPDASDGGIIEIKEKMFIAQTNDIYINSAEYLGKTIKYEGIFDSYTDEESGITYFYVIRYGPGCCGYDSNAGFEVVWTGDWPEAKDWVEVVGVLEEYEEDGNEYLRLKLYSIRVLDERGAEYVDQ